MISFRSFVTIGLIGILALVHTMAAAEQQESNMYDAFQILLDATRKINPDFVQKTEDTLAQAQQAVVQFKNSAAHVLGEAQNILNTSTQSVHNGAVALQDVDLDDARQLAQDAYKAYHDAIWALRVYNKARSLAPYVIGGTAAAITATALSYYAYATYVI